MFFTSINYVRSKAVAFLFLLFPLSVHAQVVQSGRWEVPLATNDFAGYQVVSANEMGLVLYRSLMSDEGPQIEITRLDTAPHEVWLGFIATEERLSLKKIKAVNTKSHIDISTVKYFVIYDIPICQFTV